MHARAIHTGNCNAGPNSTKGWVEPSQPPGKSHIASMSICMYNCVYICLSTCIMHTRDDAGRQSPKACVTSRIVKIQENQISVSYQKFAITKSGHYLRLANGLN